MGTVGPPAAALGVLIVTILYATAYEVTLHDNVLIWGAAAFLQLPLLLLSALAGSTFAIILVPIAFFVFVKYFNVLGSFGEDFLCYMILGYVIVVMSGVV